MTPAAARLLPLVLAAIAGGGEAAQQGGADAQAAPSGAHLRPYSAEWRIVEVDADGTAREVGRHSERFELIEHEGRPAWRQVQHDIGGPNGMIAVTERDTFRPIFAEMRNDADGAFKRFAYHADRVEVSCAGSLCPPGYTQPEGGGPARRTIPTATPTFDYWGGSFGLLFATLPLAPGLRTSVPVFNAVTGGMNLQVEVDAEEPVTVAGGTLRAYRIRTPQTRWTYHVSAQPPYWVRLEYARPDGTRQITERVIGTAAGEPG